MSKDAMDELVRDAHAALNGHFEELKRKAAELEDELVYAHANREDAEQREQAMAARLEHTRVCAINAVKAYRGIVGSSSWSHKDQAAFAELERVLHCDRPQRTAHHTPAGWQLVPALSAQESEALKRFEETLRDDGTYDLDKLMIDRLARKGAIRHLSAGRYTLTEAGQAMLASLTRPGR